MRVKTTTVMPCVVIRVFLIFRVTNPVTKTRRIIIYEGALVNRQGSGKILFVGVGYLKCRYFPNSRISTAITFRMFDNLTVITDFVFNLSHFV